MTCEPETSLVVNHLKENLDISSLLSKVFPENQTTNEEQGKLEMLRQTYLHFHLRVSRNLTRVSEMRNKEDIITIANQKEFRNNTQ